MKNILSNFIFADRDIEKLIGQLLRYGVLTASSIVLIGGVFYLSKYGMEKIPPYHHFTGEQAGYTTLSEIVKGSLALKSKGLIELGVVALILTPILRILFSLAGFIIEKDRLYTIITLIVFSVIMFSIFGGLKV